MKPLINTLIAASVLAVPVLSFAQRSTPPFTRTQMRAELGQLEAAGFKGAPAGPYYPAKLQAAEARAARQNVVMQATTCNYGPSTGGSWQSGQSGVSTDTQ